VKKPLTVHPLLFAMFPILFLFSRNMAQFSLGVVFLPLVVVALAALGLYMLLRRFLANEKKAALIVTTGLFLFFSFGHIRELMWHFSFTIASFRFGPTKILYISYFILCCTVMLAVARTRRPLIVATKALSAAGGCLVALSVLQIGVWEAKQFAYGRCRNAEDIGSPAQNSKQQGQLPDIYYIIPDEYVRHDVLAERYGYDNTEFLDYLRSKGFYVAERSMSNYTQTALSIPSSMNMNFVPNLLPKLEPQSTNLRPLGDLFRRNKVCRFLRDNGYRIVAFASGYSLTELKNADTFITCGWALDQFQNAVIDQTPMSMIARLAVPSVSHRSRVLYIFDNLKKVRSIEGPKFVFAHILCPHEPYVFARDGSPGPQRAFGLHYGLTTGNDLTGKARIQAYTNQLVFVNRKLEELIDALLSDPSYQPIIVIQSDHGERSVTLDVKDPDVSARMSLAILNAYYFPDGRYDLLSPDITPVNTFRAVFNTYLGGKFDMLENASFVNPANRPYNLKEYRAKDACPMSVSTEDQTRALDQYPQGDRREQ